MYPEQAAQLNELLAELDTLPTPELIAESGRLRCPLPLNDSGKKRLRFAIGGAIAAQKLISYIEALRAANVSRQEIGHEIYRLRHLARVRRAMQSLDAAEPAVMASHLSGQQDVAYHMFAVCAARIERFLPMAAKAAGVKVPKADLDLLKSFRPLRDYYEHLEDRLPGGKNYKPELNESDSNGEWRLQMGILLDSEGRLVINGVTVDVTDQGLAAVEAVLRRHWEQLRTSSLTLVRDYFEADPSNIPEASDVRQDFLLSTMGIEDD